jgi:putative NADPH-quinone reductase
MNISVILAHPNQNSFNHAIANSVVTQLNSNGHTVTFHDLYAESFDPLVSAGEIPTDAILSEEIEKHCREINAADGIVIVHPNWWGQPPAILKGWVDRVIRPKVAYKFLEGDGGEGVPVGLLKAKAALVFNTANTSPEREQNIFGDPLERIWKNCIFDLCGVPTFYRKMFTIVINSTLEERQNWLNQAAEAVSEYFPPLD